MTRGKTQPQSHDWRVVVVQGIEYFIYWEDMILGASFFIPTTATVQQVKAAIKSAVKHYKYKVEVRPRCEYGRYGVRVWRVY